MITRTVDGHPYYLHLTDTAGQEEYRGLWAASNLRSDAFLLVYDITAASSLDTLDYFLSMIDMECEHRQDSGLAQPVKLIAGNKCDLKDNRVVSSRQGLEFARARGCGFMETSAREMVNIEETFAFVAARKERRLATASPPTPGSRFQIPYKNHGPVMTGTPSSTNAPNEKSAFPDEPESNQKSGFWAKLRCW
ncbi:MAG: hypothetical protein LQ352_000495 [Teloschistes flavicans]|nr:MAG: hypothetical protein LQ352_000495 [Teloschistes flavicans]